MHHDLHVAGPVFLAGRSNHHQYEEVVRPLSGHIGLALPIGSIAPRVRARPLPPQTTELHPEVDRLCRKLWDSFEGCPES